MRTLACSSGRLAIERELDGQRCIVRLAGDLDRDAVPRLRVLIDEQCEAGREIVLDLHRLTFIDSAGIASILDAHGKVAEMGGELTVTAASRDVERVLQRVLEITGLERIGPFVCEPAEETAPAPRHDRSTASHPQ